jgi:signal transduction histidine kinase
MDPGNGGTMPRADLSQGQAVGEVKRPERAALSERTVLACALALLACTLVAACAYVLRAPWTELRFVAPPHGVAGLEVASYTQADLVPGERVTSVRSAQAGPVALGAELLVASPGYFHSYREYRAFFALQARLHPVLAGSEAEWLTDNGRAVRVPVEQRSLGDLPAHFFLQLLCGAVSLSFGCAFLAFRRADPCARIMFVLGAGVFLCAITFAIIEARFLVLEPAAFRALHVLNHAGCFASAWAFAVIVWYYPAPLSRAPFGAISAGFFALCFGADTWQWIDSVNLAFRVPLILPVVPVVILSLRQWRASRDHPLHRAALKWYLFTLFAGGLVVLANEVAISLTRDSLLPHGLTILAALVTFPGIAAGIWRSRLFELERWWLPVWAWFLGGLAVVFTDLALVALLDLGSAEALVIALLGCGFAWFPARQWLWRRFGVPHREDTAEAVPQLLEKIAASGDPASSRGEWRQLLARLFETERVREDGQALAAPEVRRDGLALAVPNLGGGTVELEFAAGGRRLFDRRDVRTVASMWSLIQPVLDARAAHARGAEDERRRLARDLHDDIGAGLLTLIHLSKEQAVSELARTTFKNLRTILAGIERRDSALADSLADWRAEAESRTEAAGVALGWREPERATAVQLTTAEHSAVERCLREAISNALRHARPARIEVAFALAGGVLEAIVEDDGSCAPVTEALPGRGMGGISGRLEELGGSVQFEARHPAGSRVRFSLPLSAGAAGA